VACFLAVVAAGNCAAMLLGYPRVGIRDQVRRADHVVYATVVERRRLGAADPDVPVDSCGVLYKVRIVEQFKGELGATVWFATHNILFVDRPLSAGDRVLILLRDLQRKGSPDDAERRQESREAHARIRTCGDPQTTLYLAPYEENIFPVVQEKDRASGSALWMQYSSDTIMPVELGPRKRERCERLEDGGCIKVVHARMAWEPLRNALKTWIGDVAR
jgi:hypothetical protein